MNKSFHYCHKSSHIWVKIDHGTASPAILLVSLYFKSWEFIPTVLRKRRNTSSSFQKSERFHFSYRYYKIQWKTLMTVQTSSKLSGFWRFLTSWIITQRIFQKNYSDKASCKFSCKSLRFWRSRPNKKIQKILN